MSELPPTEALRGIVAVNRQLIRERAAAEGDMATVAEMDEIDAQDQRELQATPEAKAHAYIRSLERALEDERARLADLASRLDQYRAVLNADIAQLDIKADETEYQDVRKMCQDKVQALSVAFERLDEITGRTDG